MLLCKSWRWGLAIVLDRRHKHWLCEIQSFILHVTWPFALRSVVLVFHYGGVFVRDLFQTLENFATVVCCMGCSWEQNLSTLQISLWVLGILDWLVSSGVLGWCVGVLASKLRVSVEAPFFLEVFVLDCVQRGLLYVNPRDHIVAPLTSMQVTWMVMGRFKVSETFFADRLLLFMDLDVKLNDLGWWSDYRLVW